MKDLPGNIEPVGPPVRWLDLLWASDLDYAYKLVGGVIARTASYNRSLRMNLSSISLYNISRVLKMNSKQVEQIVDEMIRLGWLFDTERGVGAAKAYALTFNVLPLALRK